MKPDYINGLFEFCGGFFILMSILKLAKDKMVRGIHWVHCAFFAAWGFWNLYYYPHLGQMASFIGGIMVVTANTYWLGQIWYYLKYPGGRKN